MIINKKEIFSLAYFFLNKEKSHDFTTTDRNKCVVPKIKPMKSKLEMYSYWMTVTSKKRL